MRRVAEGALFRTATYLTVFAVVLLLARAGEQPDRYHGEQTLVVPQYVSGNERGAGVQGTR